MHACAGLVTSCRWTDVLRCISRWELLQQLASGMPTDAALFAHQDAKGGIKVTFLPP